MFSAYRQAPLTSKLVIIGLRLVTIDYKYVLTSQKDYRRTPWFHLLPPARRAGLYRLIDQAATSHRPILISGKRSSAVLVSAEDWQAIQETPYLLSVPGMRESIKKGMAEPLGKSANLVAW